MPGEINNFATWYGNLGNLVRFGSVYDVTMSTEGVDVLHGVSLAPFARGGTARHCCNQQSGLFH